MAFLFFTVVEIRKRGASMIEKVGEQLLPLLRFLGAAVCKKIHDCPFMTFTRDTNISSVL